MSAVRMLNDAGLAGFQDFLTRRRTGSPAAVPTHLLEAPESSVKFPEAVVELRSFTSRLAAARYLRTAFEGCPLEDVAHSRGLWAWLALFYFDQLCPPRPDGGRSIRETEKYIPPPLGRVEHYRKYYRHLLAGPYNLYRIHGDRARVLLLGPLSQHPDIAEQLSSRMEIITSSTVMEVVDRLYHDASEGGDGRLRRGAVSRGRPGTVRRFVRVIQQFDLTYDLASLEPDDLMSLLPREFGRFQRT